ncbi:MAG: phosphoribosyltransferase family protein, partial [candidate division WOR-3 bacterium]
TSSETSGVVKIRADLSEPVMNRDVLLVEDIVDTGLTLTFLKENLRSRGASEVKICALLDKPARHRTQVHIDYLGFTVPDKFLVGYGIDYAERYRNLPYIGYVESAKQTGQGQRKTKRS